jgi:hypothetical protein
VKLLRPVTASLLLSTVLLAPTALWAATAQLRQERMPATQQAQGFLIKTLLEISI